LLILDGAMGSELGRRGVDTATPMWSARALLDGEQTVAAIHRDYAAAGATIHRTNTFRTRARTAGARWAELAGRAVALARGAVPATHRVAGSLGPVEDCWEPMRAPARAEALREHRALAEVLVESGVDLLIAETFAAPHEALAAVEACVSTGRETWIALTGGPDGDLLSPAAMAATARDCLSAGAARVLVNCVAAERTLPYVEALARLGAPCGAYANAARWNGPFASPEAYLAFARGWAAAGATVIGSCCGTGPAHVAALARGL
jgi:S-methylmethionine-dependent homocysteine/selenocysteine methylase